MKVGLFIPCFIDQFYPQVGIACLELLEKHGCTVSYPLDQSCCGQPLANAGYEKKTTQICQDYVRRYQDVDYIVTPSGSCAHHVKHNYPRLVESADAQSAAERTYDIIDFLVDVLAMDHCDTNHPQRVGLHIGCHSLRGLRQAQSSEIVGEEFSRPRYLTSLIPGIEIVSLSRQDECCGFGGTFAVNHGELSARMGHDRLQDHIAAGAEAIISGDMSCLMHLQGLSKRKKIDMNFYHIAELLNGLPA